MGKRVQGAKSGEMKSNIRTMGSALGPRMVIDGREVDYFCGTSYYTLHGDPRVIGAACEATYQYGMGPGTTMASPPLLEVEARAAEFFETEDAQYIISGYLGDMLLVQSLSNDCDVVFVDVSSHYSVFDGIRSTGKRIIPFCHLDADNLARSLRDNLRPKQIPLVMSDGVFPVTGAIAPLREYVNVLAPYDGALLCVDDSHAVGVIGEKGQGSLEYCGVQGKNRYLTGTLSKAFGGLGGIIPGSRDLMDKITRNVRIPVGASPPSTASAAASAMGLKILSEHPEMRMQLWSNVAYMRTGLRELGINLPDSPIPIVLVTALPGVDLKRVQQDLENEGVLVAHVPPCGYSDAPNKESLRIAVFSTHTQAQINRLLTLLRKLL